MEVAEFFLTFLIILLSVKLFAGLETDLGQVAKVGVQAFLVAITGVAALGISGSFAAGIAALARRFFLPYSSLFCSTGGAVRANPPMGFQNRTAYSKRMDKHRSNYGNNCHCS